MPAGFALVVALGLAAPGQPAPDAAPNLRIHVVAADASGRPVEQLRPEDFVILEDGTARAVDRVRPVRGAAAAPGEEPRAVLTRADERAEAAREDVRLFAIFLDEYHVGAGAPSERARRAVAAFLARQLGPRDLAVVLKPLDSLLEIRLTRDREALGRAAATFAGRKDDFAPRTAFERDYIAGSPQRIRQQRAQIATSALNALARHLGGLSRARKTLIVVSEGFVSERRSGAALPTLEAVARTASQAGVAVYVIDPGDGASSSVDVAGAAPAGLERLALETGGLAFAGGALLEASFDRIAGEAGAYFEIELAPGARPADRAVEARPVEVRPLRRGLRLRAPVRFLAPPLSPDDFARLQAPPPPTPIRAQRASALIRPWFGVARGGDGAMRVRFVWEPAARPAGTRQPLPPARVAVRATDANGVPLFEGVVEAASPASGGRDGQRRHAAFDVPPGRVQLELSIQDAASRQIDVDVRDLPVAALAGPVALGTPEVFRAHSARAFRDLAGNAGAVPSATREFSRLERLLIRLPLYAEAGQADLSATLVSRIGGVMRELTVGPGPSAEQHQIDLPLAGLAAGDYAVDISARTSAGSASERVAFRVVP